MLKKQKICIAHIVSHIIFYAILMYKMLIGLYMQWLSQQA